MLTAATALTMAAALLAGLLAVALVRPPLRSPANDCLAGVFAALALSAASAVVGQGPDPGPWAYLFADVMWVLLAVALLSRYYAALLSEERIRANRIWIFVPFLLTTVVNVYINLGNDFNLYTIPRYVAAQLADYYVIEEALTIALAVGAIGYVARLLQRHGGHRDLAWARYTARFFGAAIAVWVLSYAFSHLLEVELMGVAWSAVLVVLSAVIYRGVLRYQLLSDRRLVRALLNEEAAGDPAPAAAPVEMETGAAVLGTVREYAGVSAEAYVHVEQEVAPESAHLSALDALLSERQRYRDPDLTRDALAEEIGISGSHLGRLLARAGRPTFPQLVTSHRVSAVKRVLADPQMAHLSIVAIGEECGFRSRSAFFNAFKTATGLTPSAYRKRRREAPDT